jgi:hypothetical protein
MQRALYFLLNPTGGKGACSSPGLSVLLIFILIPSFLLTTAVCGLIYLSIRCFRRGQIAYSVVALIAALVPFLLFATRLVQASAADREHANCLAGLAKRGPVADYPNILVSRNGLLLHDSAARLMLVAGFREVDLIGSVPYGGNEPYTETMTLTPIGDCREKLEAWVGKRSRHV